MQSILLIDDDPCFRELSQIILSEADYAVWTAPHPRAAFSFLFEQNVDLVICDLHMPFSEGEEQKDYPYSIEVGFRTTQELADALPAETKLIVLSSLSAIDLRRLSGFLPSVPLYPKPVKPGELVTLVDETLKIPTAREELVFQ